MREILTNYRKANAILQKLGPSKKEWILLVEGKSDRVFFGKFVITKLIQINACDGNKNLLDIAKILRDRKHQKFIGIIDSDFRRLDGNNIVDSQIFQTDYHDIEVSILETRALSDVLNKYSSEDRLNTYIEKSGKEFIENLYELSKPLGYLKWANKLNKLGLVFKPERANGNKIKYEKFINKNTLNFISDDSLIDYLIQYSKNRKTTVCSKVEIKNKFNQVKKSVVDEKQLCNGHDMSFIISLALKKVIGATNISGDTIEENLIFAYDSSDFKKTVLYKTIQLWEKKNNKLFN